MKCSTCGSEWHLRRWCPRKKGGKDSGKGGKDGKSSGNQANRGTEQFPNGNPVGRSMLGLPRFLASRRV
eukprot:137940-Prorocentrum_lima.AAC.1